MRHCSIRKGEYLLLSISCRCTMLEQLFHCQTRAVGKQGVRERPLLADLDHSLADLSGQLLHPYQEIRVPVMGLLHLLDHQRLGDVSRPPNNTLLFATASTVLPFSKEIKLYEYAKPFTAGTYNDAVILPEKAKSCISNIPPISMADPPFDTKINGLSEGQLAKFNGKYLLLYLCTGAIQSRCSLLDGSSSKSDAAAEQ